MTSAYNPQASVPHCVISCHSPAAHIHMQQSFQLKRKRKQITVDLSDTLIFKEQVCSIKVPLKANLSTWRDCNNVWKAIFSLQLKDPINMNEQGRAIAFILMITGTAHFCEFFSIYGLNSYYSTQLIFVICTYTFTTVLLHLWLITKCPNNQHLWLTPLEHVNKCHVDSCNRCTATVALQHCALNRQGRYRMTYLSMY